MNEYVYLYERLFANADDDVINHTSQVIPLKEQRIKQHQDINDVLKLMFCHNGCWHSFVEYYCANPMEPPFSSPTWCGAACPYCLRQRKDYIMKIRKDGLKVFLMHTFMGVHSNENCPSYVLKQLKNYPNVGRVIYNRPKSVTPPEARFIESTIMQLIASEIL